MRTRKETLPAAKSIALIAHDHLKLELLDWVAENQEVLERHRLFATGTTGTLISSQLDIKVSLFRSGPLGGDQQVGAAITEGKIDVVIFFSDPLHPHPHDVDVRAILRIAVVYNIPIACNPATADFLIRAPQMSTEYERSVIDRDEVLASSV